MAKIYNWENEIDNKELEECVNTIKNGGTIIFPTDTVYGIGCNVFDNTAIDKIFKIKGRDYNKPINVLCDDIDDIEILANKLNKHDIDIIKKYMPGACTLIVDKNNKISDLLTAKLDTVGVRIPDNQIARTLIRKCKIPIATTSANISGKADGIDFYMILEQFKDKVDIIINGGISKIGIPSTIVRCENNKIKILRQGSIYIRK